MGTAARAAAIAAFGAGGAARLPQALPAVAGPLGASDDEVARPLPGDEVVGRADWNATRAVTVAATPAQIWPFLVQVGWGRAGWYGYDWVDDGGKPSTCDILPAHQHLEVGKEFPMSPVTAMVCVDFRHEEWMLWLSFMRKVLLGIKARAESLAVRRLAGSGHAHAHRWLAHRPAARRAQSRHRHRRLAGRPASRERLCPWSSPPARLRRPWSQTSRSQTTTSSERPNLRPTSRRMPTRVKPSRSASASPASFSAQIWAITACTSRRGAASSAARARARPTPVALRVGRDVDRGLDGTFVGAARRPARERRPAGDTPLDLGHETQASRVAFEGAPPRGGRLGLEVEGGRRGEHGLVVDRRDGLGVGGRGGADGDVARGHAHLPCRPRHSSRPDRDGAASRGGRDGARLASGRSVRRREPGHTARRPQAGSRLGAKRPGGEPFLGRAR